MTLLVGRITHDAKVNTLKDDRQVVNFAVAINDWYKAKETGELVKKTTFVNCAYWVSSKVAAYLKKSTIVEIYGRIYADSYIGADGQPKHSLNCHVNGIKIHHTPKTATVISKADTPPRTDAADDLPF